MSEKKDALLPCPFCGGEAIYKKPEHNLVGWCAHCIECFACSEIHDELPAAIAAWNRRPEPQWTEKERFLKEKETAETVTTCAVCGVRRYVSGWCQCMSPLSVGGAEFAEYVKATSRKIAEKDALIAELTEALEQTDVMPPPLPENKSGALK